MSKLVYKSEDGTPVIIDETTEYNFEWTETPPPEGIYSPFYFNGVEWIGSSKEEFEESNPIDPYEPSATEIELAKTQMELFKAQLSIEQLRQDNANIIKKLVEMEGGVE
ncbi:hypothetical protein [Mammaliicoccus sciuri]|uniref:hypothetical protein n=1 Tax=Mammaliicoccus sciuri TaxID=1296 RepID=UPI0028862983|nr:hypothetical protein [Mammaliicoccus sciuri]MDT0694770.1 hypothetical protein [Mammaliicoccus sciuri]